ncbi:4Fe-4S binding protein [Anaerosporobacter sp.]|uniref:4Fe-4S binding protein n=1 Tax=Anaerosporobacter sp. TaxID=1872529 RepID=UPI00286ECFE5|nr:4Fe-4S binding protein [Anaerosporobacter sp.]
MKKIREGKRRIVQMIATALSNGYVAGFMNGTIYKGESKRFCVPGLNCYSCPGALGSCPLGSLQAVIASPEHRISFYMVGFFLMIGSLLGRFVCGWLCPFGFIQDLLYKIPFFRKSKSLPGHSVLKYMKYVILALFVIILPMFVVDIIGQGEPWFCKWICPAGTLEGGWLLSILNPKIRGAIGLLFAWKSVLLVIVIILSIYVYRPFCKYICPLGAIYGFFNRFAFYQLTVSETACTKCGACTKACPMEVQVPEKPYSAECIRCGVCKSICPHQAIHMGINKSPASKADNTQV